MQQQQEVQRPATGAAPVQQRDVPVPQGTPQIQPPVSVPQPSAVRQSPTGTTPPPRVQSIDELKDALVQHLLIEHTMLSAAVGKTLNWRERDGILYMAVHNPFEVQQLQREKNILTRKTAELYGKELKIQITLAQEETVQKVSVPARVEMVLRNIKGSIVDIQKKVVVEEPEEE
ncbi:MULTISPECIES: DNA polymerase III subunit gamma/tau [unclassified Treponema]|uniref:DNA polymerase III subunit gamma/tau n=1 Tax=unclassified Treponema TaxID=2638727 RepID=UPI000A68B21E|nr:MULTISPECIES: DNA polymerase III subunit gamma/tau [unclassified Treponema]